jgi:hypothetical protein
MYVLQKQVMGGVSVQKVCSSSGADTNMSTEQFLSSLQSSLEVMGVEEGGVLKEGDMGDVSKFLNRLLGLKVLNQNMMFAYFCECLSVIISIAKKEGRFNEGVTDIRGQSIEMVGSPKEVFMDYKLSHVPTIHTHVVVDRGVSWEKALQLYDQHIADHQPLVATESASAGGSGQGGCRGSGFYCSKREQYHRHLYLLALQKENSTHLFNITRPNTGRSLFEETKADLLSKYVLVSSDKAEKGWKSQYEMTEKHCIHGAYCKNRESCLIGSRLTHIHLLSGGILPLLSLLESTLTRHANTMALSKEARSLRVVRVRLDDGRRIIGVRYPLPLISEVASMLSMLSRSKQVDHSKALPVVIPMAAKDILLETQSPINKKSLAKALTPPISLKNFFPVQPKVAGPVYKDDRSGPVVKDQKHFDTATGMSPDFSGGGGDQKEQPKKVNSESGSAKLKPVQKRLHDFAAASSTTKRGPVTSEGVESSRKGRSLSERGQSSAKRKRKLEVKPGSSSDSLTKMFKQAESVTVVICPVCNLQLEAQSNSAINLHLDKCLPNTTHL